MILQKLPEPSHPRPRDGISCTNSTFNVLQPQSLLEMLEVTNPWRTGHGTEHSEQSSSLG